jgi:AraC family transcriptional activator of tynA and feaB
MGPMMLQSDSIAGASLRDFEAWKDLVERLCGGYRSDGIAPKAFRGWVRPLNVYGLTARDVGCNAQLPRPTDKLFARICGMIRSGFSDPDFGPVEVAAAAGISLRYLQKLFTERGSTCSEFIYSLRLDYAAHLLRRRASMDSGQPLSEIAYGCGFRDYTHFSRKFRRRIGCAPGAYSGADVRPRPADIVRPGPSERAFSARDVQPSAT